MVFRRHYIHELGLVKAREIRREKEETSQVFPTDFLEEVRLRNRLDRLRRACREQISADEEVSRLLEAGPASPQLDPLPSYVLAEDADPLPLGTNFRSEIDNIYNSFTFGKPSENV